MEGYKTAKATDLR